jgi:hypothetical protein
LWHERRGGSVSIENLGHARKPEAQHFLPSSVTRTVTRTPTIHLQPAQPNPGKPHRFPKRRQAPLPTRHHPVAKTAHSPELDPDADPARETSVTPTCLDHLTGPSHQLNTPLRPVKLQHNNALRPAYVPLAGHPNAGTPVGFPLAQAPPSAPPGHFPVSSKSKPTTVSLPGAMDDADAFPLPLSGDIRQPELFLLFLRGAQRWSGL